MIDWQPSCARHGAFESVSRVAFIAALCTSPVQADEVLATVAEVEITVGQLQHEVARRGVAPDSAARRELLEGLIHQRLEIEAARAAGYQHEAEIVDALERLLASRWQRDRLQPRLSAVTVDEGEVASHYADHRHEYSTAEQVHIALVLLPPTEGDEPLVPEILTAASALDPDGGFGDLARRHSTDHASRYVGGDVGWWVRGDGQRWPPEVVAAGFALRNLGDIEVVRLADALYLLRLIERRPAAQRPLERVAAEIRRQLEQRKRDQLRRALYDELSEQFAVVLDTKAIERMLSETAAPPAIPGDQQQISRTFP